MTRHAPRRPNVSRPLLAALLLAIGLVALAYLRDADEPAPDAPTTAPASTGAKNAAAAKTAAGPTATAGKGDGAPHDSATIALGAAAATAPDSAAAAGSTTASGAGPQASQQPTATLAATPGAPVDIFPSQRWDPPPPPPNPAATAAPAPATPPQPPALPFTVRSLWLDADGTFYVVLNASGREFPVCVGCKRRGFLRKGDVLMETYRIEDINRRELRLQFLPLKRQQKLSLGGGK